MNENFNDTESLERWRNFLETALPENSTAWVITTWIMMAAIFVAGLVGNLLTWVVICCDRSMRTATNYYVLNMATSDLIVCVTILLEGQEHLSTGQYQFSRFECKTHFLMIVLFLNNGVLTMTTLAIERYIAVFHPMLLKSTPVWKRVMKVIALIWLVAIAETLPELSTVELVQTRRASYCFTLPTRSTRVVSGVVALSTFVIPLLIMTYVYTMIALKVRDSEKINAENMIVNYHSNSSRVNNLVLALSLSFVVCWLPFFVMRLFTFFLDLQAISKFARWWGVVYKLMLINSWLTIALNPLLFSLMSTKFRKALQDLWSTWMRVGEQLA